MKGLIATLISLMSQITVMLLKPAILAQIGDRTTTRYLTKEDHQIGSIRSVELSTHCSGPHYREARDMKSLVWVS